MQGRIQFTMARDDDGSGQLSVEVWSKGFSGHGAAYFDLAFLSKMAKRFAEYPLTGDSLKLAGGFFARGDATKLEQEHVSISAYPLGQLGRLGLRVAVAEPSEDERGVLSRATAMEFIVQYEHLSAISTGLVALAEGPLDVFSVEFPE